MPAPSGLHARLCVLEHDQAQLADALEHSQSVQEAFRLKCKYQKALVERLVAQYRGLPFRGEHRCLRQDLVHQLRQAIQVLQKLYVRADPRVAREQTARHIAAAAALKEDYYTGTHAQEMPGCTTAAPNWMPQYAAGDRRPGDNRAALPRVATDESQEGEDVAPGDAETSRHRRDRAFDRARQGMYALRRNLEHAYGVNTAHTEVRLESFCPDCGESMELSTNESLMWCKPCRRLEEYKEVTTQTTEYGRRKEVRRERCPRRETLEKELRRAQALESFRVPEEVTEEVAHHIADLAALSGSPLPDDLNDLTFPQFNDIVRGMRKYYARHAPPSADPERGIPEANLELRKNMRKYYSYMMQMYCVVFDKDPPSFSRIRLRRIHLIFQEIQEPFELLKRQRDKFLKYKYYIHKICEMSGYADMLQYFPLLKTGQTLLEHDTMWHDITNHCNLPFYPSKPVKCFNFLPRPGRHEATAGTPASVFAHLGRPHNDTSTATAAAAGDKRTAPPQAEPPAKRPRRSEAEIAETNAEVAQVLVRPASAAAAADGAGSGPAPRKRGRPRGTRAERLSESKRVRFAAQTVPVKHNSILGFLRRSCSSASEAPTGGGAACPGA